MRSLAGERPWRFTWVIIVQSLAGIGQAIGMLLLIPLLGAVGVGARSGLTHSIRSVFTSVGVRPTLIVVLVTYALVTAASTALSAPGRALIVATALAATAAALISFCKHECACSRYSG